MPLPNPFSNRNVLWLAAWLAVPALHAHVHVQVGYPGGAWDLHVFDFESGRLAPDEAPLFVALAARQPMPADPRYGAFLGSGANVWILPQIEAPGILNLGLGTSGIAAGVFGGNQLRLELHRLEGPGDFAVFTVTPFGAPVVHFNSRDGIAPASDFLALPAVNGHVHVNWAFTAPGVYRVGLAASGTRVATGQNSVSPVTDFTFVVEAPPVPRLEVLSSSADGTFELRISAPAGTPIEVQSATELGNWRSLGALTATGQPQAFTASAPAASQRFFRAITP